MNKIMILSLILSLIIITNVNAQGCVGGGVSSNGYVYTPVPVYSNGCNGGGTQYYNAPPVVQYYNPVQYVPVYSAPPTTNYYYAPQPPSPSIGPAQYYHYEYHGLFGRKKSYSYYGY